MSTADLQFRIGGLDQPEIVALLEDHLAELAPTAPAESRHALNLEGLSKPDVTFWSVWQNDHVIGCGALKELDAEHGEVKSMRTVGSQLRKGIGSMILQRIIAEAKLRGYRRLSLETGSMSYFEPARSLYRKHGFQLCPPFNGYIEDSNSVFMTLRL
jgi:putative acetyltransferase